MNDRRIPRGFKDRAEAGRALARKLTRYAKRPDVLVLALPRGGVPVAYEVAAALDLPMDVFVVRKLGVPGQSELAMGAIASGGTLVLNEDVVEALGITQESIRAVQASEQQELTRRERLYRDDQPAPQVRDRIVILIDDGLATGATMQAAVDALRLRGPARIVVAAPVASPQACDHFGRVADECVCVLAPEYFGGVGRWYESFEQTSDEEVRQALARLAKRRSQSALAEPSAS
ncbi:MAG: phosphoribosyltransferase [Planctomycetes bacterium]|nr:phosphoribosyltransferase [Planctomycetota bacterium]